jgi:MEDS: MEthanogen/methylotroph, DcmR Sensory domain
LDASNVIPLTEHSRQAHRGQAGRQWPEGGLMASWAELLKRAEPGDHLVQLYGEDDGLLAKNVSRYLAEGLRQLDGLLVIATPEHTQAITRYLVEETGGATLEAEREGRLRFLDARATLDRLLRDGQPDERLFEAILGSALRDAQLHSGSGKVRAFGEMVGLLWSEEQYVAAELLERLWNAALAERPYSLYCAYGIDLFRPESDPSGLNPIVGAHTHLFAGPGTLLSSRRAFS